MVGLNVDVRIDAEGDARGSAFGLGCLAQRSELRLRLDVEGEDAGAEREVHLGAGLADAREHDPVRRYLDRESASELAFRHHVHAGAEPRQRGEHAEIGVGLDRIADQRAGLACERVGEHAVMTLERRCRITIEGGSYRGGEIGKVNLRGVEHSLVGHAAPVGEMVHREGNVYSRSLSIHRRRAGAFDIFVDGSAWTSG